MYNLVENANVVQIYIVDSTFVLKYGCTQLSCRSKAHFHPHPVDEQMQQVLPGKQKRLTLSIIYNIIKLVKLNLRVNCAKVISENNKTSTICILFNVCC
jgi:hypothetical protein